MDKLAAVRQAVEDGFYDVDDLVLMLEITVEDLLERFGDRLVTYAEKFGVEEALFPNEEGDRWEEEVEEIEGEGEEDDILPNDESSN